MTDIRNPVVLAMPTSVMPSLNPTAGSTSCVLGLNKWTGDPATWAVTREATASLSITGLRAIGTGIASLLAGATGPLTVTDGSVTVTLSAGASAGRAVVFLTIDGTGPHPIDVASGYAARCGEALALPEIGVSF